MVRSEMLREPSTHCSAAAAARGGRRRGGQCTSHRAVPLRLHTASWPAWLLRSRPLNGHPMCHCKPPSVCAIPPGGRAQIPPAPRQMRPSSRSGRRSLSGRAAPPRTARGPEPVGDQGSHQGSLHWEGAHGQPAVAPGPGQRRFGSNSTTKPPGPTRAPAVCCAPSAATLAHLPGCFVILAGLLLQAQPAKIVAAAGAPHVIACRRSRGPGKGRCRTGWGAHAGLLAWELSRHSAALR